MTKRTNHLTKAVWIYLFAFLLLVLNFHAEAQNKEKAADAVSTEAPKKTTTPPKETASPASSSSAKAAPAKTDKKGKKPMFATIETTLGKIRIKLHAEESPITVENFAGLAEGSKEWTDPKTGKKVKRPFYDGLIFHRVIPGFMIQGGDPKGDGTGGPGYQFKNENHPLLKHDKAGVVAMANAGRDTNGSQFYITTGKQSSLDGGYTVFGQVVEGQEVIDAISKVKRNHSDRPDTDVVMKKVTIERG